MIEKNTRLFKYIKSKHAESFFHRGNIRIGTLHEYRDLEKHGHVIGDHQEGILSEQELHENLVMKSDKDVPSFMRGRIKIGAGSTVHMINSTFSVTDQSPDFYMYCVTTEFNPELMKEFGCDKCIEIMNVEKFIESLSRCIRHKGRFIGAFSCVYTERVVSPGSKPPYHPAIVKDPKYANQKEVRFLWEPKNTNPRPLKIGCRKLSKYCKYANNA